MYFQTTLLAQLAKVLFLAIVLCALPGCKKKGSYYGVTLGNYSNQGIIFYELPLHKFSDPKEWKKYPGVPGVRDDISRFHYFVDHPRRLPDQISIKWQLAELTNCKHVNKGRAKRTHLPGDNDENDSNIYIWKNSCDWNTLTDKLFETTLDLRPYKNHEAILKMGKKREDGGTYGASIMLAFYGENDIRVTIKEVGTPPFPGFYN